MKIKKLLLSILSIVMAVIFATPVLAASPAQEKSLDNVLSLINAQVEAMELQDIVTQSTSTSFSELISECGARWLVPVYTIETTELAMALSSSAVEEMRVFTQVACTQNLIPLTRTIVRDDPTRSLRFSLTTTVQISRPPNAAVDYALLTRVRGNTTVLAPEGRVTGGTVNMATQNPFYTMNQVHRDWSVGASFYYNTNFTIPVPAVTPSSAVGATWNVRFNIRTTPMELSIENFFVRFF
ncbi:MAG: hypothetical protein FWB96_09585 [Defluviitaleaceae bacterium]|nr:hypothetical protein [Defluviitaleaceae bacterium]MCL2263068.1 hypothetical protein [Defluviitaleaceae bacterium]